MTSLVGKSAVVTGVCFGIGYAVVKKCLNKELGYLRISAFDEIIKLFDYIDTQWQCRNRL